MVASLLVSVLLVGIRLNAAKEIVQIIERRKELRTNLSLLKKSLEGEETVAWINDVKHDAKQREDTIAAIESASGRSCSPFENSLIEEGLGMFDRFDQSSGAFAKLKHSVTVERSETTLDEATGLVLERETAEIRATPQEILAYSLNFDGRHIQSDWNPATSVRSDLLERVNSHHSIIFTRRKAWPLRPRTFLNSLVAKRLAEEPPTYALVAMPIAGHAKIGRKDEMGAIRSENRRCFKLTEVAPGITKMEYVNSLNLKGSVSQRFTNAIAIPGQQHGAPCPSVLTLFLCGPSCFAHTRCLLHTGGSCSIGCAL